MTFQATMQDQDHSLAIIKCVYIYLPFLDKFSLRQFYLQYLYVYVVMDHLLHTLSRVMICEENTRFHSNMGYIFHLKCCFKSICEKKLQTVSPWALSFMCCRRNVYHDPPIPGNLPCPEKFLVASLGS